jgi:signal transduction histidine kinase
MHSGAFEQGGRRDGRFKEKVQEDALSSLAHETANGLNAIRANLMGFNEANSLPSAAEHLKQVERALARIEAALEKAVRKTQPNPASASKTASEALKSKVA